MATARSSRTSRAAEPADAAPARGRSSSRAAPAAPASSGYRGAAGLRKMQEESVAADARREASKALSGAPFRFFLKAGETREVVIVDEMPDFFRHEHTIQDKRSKLWNVHTACIDDHANCPVCAAAERPSYFAMYLTIIDLSPFTTKDGEQVEFSKKLLVIKQMQQKKFMRLYDQHKSLRGMVLELTRDSDKDAAIGNDIAFIEFMDEDELLTYQTEYVDKEKKVHLIDCSEPYDYDAIFPEMTETQLRAMVGGKPGPGSREDTDRALGRGSRDNASNWDDDAPASRRTASRRGAPQDDDQDAAPVAPRRAARGTPAAAPVPAARRSARAAAPVDDDIDPDTGAPWESEGEAHEAEEQDAPQRPARNARAAPPVAEPVARTGVAARRASLRR